jgi:hypothetical protein
MGEVITFHSYKGGAGRSMALANIACLLVRERHRGTRVLMVDWDLDAPGLHRFFYEHLPREGVGGRFDQRPGLIDFFIELRDRLARFGRLRGDEAYGAAAETLNEVSFEQYPLATDIPGLYLLKAGRLDERYYGRVADFNWEKLFRACPPLLPVLAERLGRGFDYVLIDSRSGHTDTGGICTMLMPEKLVAVFTPNAQSIYGTLSTARQAAHYRLRTDDLRPLVVFPLPSRVEPSEPELRHRWRQEYQHLFERLFSDVYDLRTCDLGPYFDEVQIQHSPLYSYGEEIAVLKDSGRDRFSIARSYATFCDRLIRHAIPWN